MSTPTCPNHTTCNFFKAASDESHPSLKPLSERYCTDSTGCTKCFRAHFARSNGANLSSDIAPNARLIKGLATVLPPSDLAADQTARVFALAAA